MKTPIKTIIVAVPLDADAATQDELAWKANKQQNGGYEPNGAPFFSGEMTYRAMPKPVPQN